MAALLLIAGGAFSSLYITGFFTAGVSTQTHDTKAVESFEFKEDITLISLGVTGILEEEKSAELFGGWKVPGTEKNVLILYRYQANLGIDGTKVDIEKTGDHSFTVEVPAFELKGLSFTEQDGEGPFKKINTADGLLSFVTADIDESAMHSRIVTDDGAELINENTDHLRSQAESFFTGIITAVDPDASIDFEFADQTSTKE